MPSRMQRWVARVTGWAPERVSTHLRIMQEAQKWAEQCEFDYTRAVDSNGERGDLFFALQANRNLLFADSQRWLLASARFSNGRYLSLPMPRDFPADWPTEPRAGLRIMLKPRGFEPEFLEPEWSKICNVMDYLTEATIIRVKPNGDLQVQLRNEDDFFNFRKKFLPNSPPVNSLENTAIVVRPGEFWLLPPDVLVTAMVSSMSSVFRLTEERAEVSKLGKKYITACTCVIYEKKLKGMNDNVDTESMYLWAANRGNVNSDGSASCEVHAEVVQCAFCQKKKQHVQNLKRCSRCHKAWYCNKKCQRGHWSEHKKTCRAAEPLAQMAFERLFDKVKETCLVEPQH